MTAAATPWRWGGAVELALGGVEAAALAWRGGRRGRQGGVAPVAADTGEELTSLGERRRGAGVNGVRAALAEPRAVALA